MIFFRVCRRSDGWTITDPLPDIDSLGQSFIDYLEISEPPFSVLEAGEKPGKNLEEYKYRLSKARRRAATKRLNELTAAVDGLIHRIVFELRHTPRRLSVAKRSMR